MGWRIDESPLDSLQGQDIFIFSKASGPALETTQWVPKGSFPGIMKPTTDLHVDPRLRMIAAVLTLLLSLPFSIRNIILKYVTLCETKSKKKERKDTLYRLEHNRPTYKRFYWNFNYNQRQNVQCLSSD